jgi:hypothetical protein
MRSSRALTPTAIATFVVGCDGGCVGLDIIPLSFSEFGLLQTPLVLGFFLIV